MSKDNPFAGVGSVVKGRRFIGRESEVRRIREKLLGQDDFGSLAFTGMPRIGKSSLAHHALVHNQNDKRTSLPMVVTHMDVSMCTTSNTFFDGIVRRIEAALTDHSLLDQGLSSHAKRVLELEDEGAKFFEIERLFRKLNKADIRAICILDEFDSIRSVFHGKPHCFKFLRELASGGDCKAGFLLLSKRPLSDISVLAGIDPKYWKNVLEEYSLTGFDDFALDLYFERLKEAGIQCEADIRSEVLALCGPHPFLLDWFAYEAFQLNATGRQLDKKVCATILTPALLELCKLVREVLEDTRWVSKLTQILIGPRVDVTNEDINSLVKYGVLVRDSKGQLQPFAPALTSLLKREKAVSIKPASTPTTAAQSHKLEGPFQLDCSTGTLKAGNGFKTAVLPAKYLFVLKAMLGTDSSRYKSIKTSLSYTEVAAHYTKGRIEEEPSEMLSEHTKLKKAQASDCVEEYMKKIAQQFKRGFRVWLNKSNIEIDDIVLCDRNDGAYRLGNFWGNPATIYGSEASLLSVDHKTLEGLAAPKTGKAKSRSQERTPDRDESED